MHPEIQQGEVGPATLCVAHSIRIFDVWPPITFVFAHPRGVYFFVVLLRVFAVQVRFFQKFFVVLLRRSVVQLYVGVM